MMPQANADGLWLVIPTYNEAENIVPLLSAILQTLPKAHLLVVDDASPDGTAERVAAMQRHFERVHLLRRTGKLGYATAIVTGLEFALRQGATIVGHMDADFPMTRKASLPCSMLCGEVLTSLSVRAMWRVVALSVGRCFGASFRVALTSSCAPP